MMSAKVLLLRPQVLRVITFVATLTFDNLAAIQSALSSAEGQAAVADVQNFATGGWDVIMFDTRAV
jgi:uncharacterized protein (TIGR02118 family)